MPDDRAAERKAEEEGEPGDGGALKEGAHGVRATALREQAGGGFGGEGVVRFDPRGGGADVQAQPVPEVVG